MSSNPEDNLTPAEIENLNRLEAIAEHGLESYVQVGNALAAIRDRQLYRDSHGSFEKYARERWGVNIPDDQTPSQPATPGDESTTPAAAQQPPAAPRSKPCEVLAKACEETLAALDGDDGMDIEIRVAVREKSDPRALTDEHSWDPWKVADAIDGELLPTLRWLLTQASGTIGKVAHQLERRAVDIDDAARAQLQDDVLVLDDELEALRELLFGLVDWDAELERLLKDESPPRDPEDDE